MTVTYILTGYDESERVAGEVVLHPDVIAALQWDRTNCLRVTHRVAEGLAGGALPAGLTWFVEAVAE